MSRHKSRESGISSHMKNALNNFQLAFSSAKYQNNDLFAYPIQHIDKNFSNVMPSMRIELISEDLYS
jgi:hypothetical protein